MKNVAMLTKAAPAIARAVPAEVAWLLAWSERKKLPTEWPAKDIGLIRLHTKIPAYASGMHFNRKPYSSVNSLSYNLALQGTPAPQAALRLALRAAPDGGR